MVGDFADWRVTPSSVESRNSSHHGFGRSRVSRGREDPQSSDSERDLRFHGVERSFGLPAHRRRELHSRGSDPWRLREQTTHCIPRPIGSDFRGRRRAEGVLLSVAKQVSRESFRSSRSEAARKTGGGTSFGTPSALGLRAPKQQLLPGELFSSHPDRTTSEGRERSLQKSFVVERASMHRTTAITPLASLNERKQLSQQRRNKSYIAI